MIDSLSKSKDIRGVAARIISKVIIYSVLIFCALIILVPLYVIFITSIKNRLEAASIPFTWWPKTGFSFAGYKELFTYKSGLGDTIPTIIRGFINTFIIVIPTSLIGTLVSATAAYAFAKLRFPGKNIMFLALLTTMMIPGIIMMIPTYAIFDAIGWVDTFYPLMVPAMFGGATSIFFLRQYYSGLPNDLLEAANIDGMSFFMMFFKIIFPLSVPAFFAQFLFAFVGGYNNYLGALIYLQSPSKYTLQLALRFFSNQASAVKWDIVMAGAVTALLPTLLIYILMQKHIVEGIATSGMKL